MREFLQINESVTYSEGLNKPVNKRFSIPVEPKTTVAEFKKLYTDKLIELNAKDDNLIAEVNISFPKHSTVNNQALISSLITDNEYGKVLFVEATIKHKSKSEDKLPPELVNKIQSFDDKRTIKVNSSVIFSIPESKVFDEGQIITSYYAFDRSKTIRELKKDFQASFPNSPLPNNEYEIDQISVSLPQHLNINDDSYIADIIGNNDTLDISINVDCQKKGKFHHEQKNPSNDKVHVKSPRKIKVQAEVIMIGTIQEVEDIIFDIYIQDDYTINELKDSLKNKYNDSLSDNKKLKTDKLDVKLSDYPKANDSDSVLVIIGNSDEIMMHLNVNLKLKNKTKVLTIPPISLTSNDQAPETSEEKVNQKYVRITFSPTPVYPDEFIQSQEYSHYYTIGKNETFGNLRQKFIDHISKQNDEDYEFDRTEISFSENINDDDLVLNTIGDENSLNVKVETFFKEKQIDQGDQAQKDEELINRFYEDLNERLSKLVQPTPTTSHKKATIAATAILCTTALVGGIILCKYLMNKSAAAGVVIKGIENLIIPSNTQSISNMFNVR